MEGFNPQAPGESRGSIPAASTTCPCRLDSSLVCPGQGHGTGRCSPGTSSASPQRLCLSEQPSLSSLLGSGLRGGRSVTVVPRAPFWDASHASAPSLIHHRQLAGRTWAAGTGVLRQPALSQPHVARCEERRKTQSCEQGKMNHSAKHPDYCRTSPGQAGCS